MTYYDSLISAIAAEYTCSLLLPELFYFADSFIHYSMPFDNRDDTYVVNNHGLDDKVVGKVDIESLRDQETTTYIHLGGRTYFQFAGDSQRDECLGNLNFCPQGNK